MELLRERRMAVSFEMVTGSHGHHGQLPAAEYLVTTAAHTLDVNTAKPIFLTWLEWGKLCALQLLGAAVSTKLPNQVREEGLLSI
eukprot:scaffold100494_cov23-Tisochrysis_lutea.AAC.1